MEHIIMNFKNGLQLSETVVGTANYTEQHTKQHISIIK